MQAQTKIRKDLRYLNDDQLKHYFFLYKLLRIFTPDPEKNKLNVQDYKFRAQITNENNFTEVTPTCYYDVLISMHCNTCQHKNQFFPYWHRWLVGKFQQFLQQVEDKISSNDISWIKIQAKRLFTIGSTNTRSPQPKQAAIQNYLKKIKKAYDTLSKKWYGKVAAHYWNVFDNTQEINYPKQFTQKISELQDLDNLINAIWGEDGLLQFNFKTRWYGNKIKEALDDEKGYLKTNNFQLTPTAEQLQKLINNNQFWKDPDRNTQNKFQQLESLFSKNLSQTNYFNDKTTKVQRHTLKQYKIKHNVFGIKDINLLFGGKGRSYYKQTGDLKKMRNLCIPYYQYAMALKTDPIHFMDLFCTTVNHDGTSIENPHNFMHNNLGSMMNDANFSVINPIFFAYHSFIDLMLQIKIQWINAEIRPWNEPDNSPGDKDKGYKSALYFMDSDFQAKGMQRTFQTKWSQYQHKFHPTTNVSNREYPILSYINPNWQNAKDFDKQFIKGQPTYQDLIIDRNNQRLKDLQTASSTTYDIKYDDPENKLIRQLIEVTKSLPNSQEKLYVNVQMKYRSTIKSCNSIVVLRDSEKKFIDSAPIGIFSKGLGAESCPNCPKFHVHNVKIPIPITQQQSKKQTFISKMGKIISLKSNRSEIHFHPEYDAKSNIYPHINNQQVVLRVKTGRKLLDVTICKSKYQGQISLSFIGQVPTFQENNMKTKTFVSNYERHSVSSSTDVQFRMNADGGKIITQIVGYYTQKDRETIRFSYKFPLYSDHTKFKINVDTLWSINEKSTMEQRAECLTENPLGFTHPSQLPPLRVISFNEDQLEQ